ncbi:hypothetical protein [Alteromonas sp. S167]|uniref:hypothetical protein n=1 Tax=Alteromonas sp. S167 TaxID=3117402 RepID=UPI002FE02A45
MKKKNEQLTFDFEQAKNPLEEVIFILYEIVILRSFEADSDINFASLNSNEQKHLLIAYLRDNIPEEWKAEPVVSLIEKLHKPQYSFY